MGDAIGDAPARARDRARGHAQVVAREPTTDRTQDSVKDPSKDHPPDGVVRRALTALAVLGATGWVRSLRIHGVSAALPPSGILVLWHTDMLPCLRAFSGRRMRVLVSQSADGDFAAAAAARLGYRVTRGSSSRGGVAALKGLARALETEGGWAAFVADGPRGPRAVCKPGAAWLARTTRLPVVAVRAHAPHGFTLGGWARVRIPWPFTRVSLRASAPFDPVDARDVDNVMKGLGEWEREKRCRPERA